MRLTRTVEDSCAEHSFPTTTAELIEEQGETELELPNGAVTLGEVLGRLPGHELETAEDAEHTIYSALSEDAIGRKEYSDRDPRCPGEGTTDQVSL
jgi:hypothetical protein